VPRKGQGWLVKSDTTVSQNEDYYGKEHDISYEIAEEDAIFVIKCLVHIRLKG